MGGCARFQGHVGTPSVILSEMGSNASCRLELDVFTPGFGAFGRELKETVPTDVAWVDAGLSSGVLTIPLPEPRAAEIAVWLVADPADQPAADAIADLMVAKLNPFLETQGVGVTAIEIRRRLALLAVPHDCAQAGSIASNPAVFDTNRINAYFVPHYLDAPYGAYGMDCWVEGFPQILFISFANEFNPDVTLLHELGHALALRYPNATVGGHTNYVAGFDLQNLMWSGAAEILNVSVGQIYGINFAEIAWLNRLGSPAPGGVVRACQQDWGPGSCPALTMFVAGWP